MAAVREVTRNPCCRAIVVMVSPALTVWVRSERLGVSMARFCPARLSRLVAKPTDP